jgi:hypothetical protein
VRSKDALTGDKFLQIMAKHRPQFTWFEEQAEHSFTYLVRALRF